MTTTDLNQQNPYKVLGVSRDATQKEINDAYGRMIKNFDSSAENFSHAGQPSLEERIALAQEAYNTLSNKKKRSVHNQFIDNLEEKPTPNSAQAAGRQMQLSLRKSRESNGNGSTRQNVYRDY